MPPAPMRLAGSRKHVSLLDKVRRYYKIHSLIPRLPRERIADVPSASYSLNELSSSHQHNTSKTTHHPAKFKIVSRHQASLTFDSTDATLVETTKLSSLLNFLSGAQRADATEPISDVTLGTTEDTVTKLTTDEEHAPKPQHGVKRKDPFGKIVDIIIGSDDLAETFEIHRSKLRSNSDYFKAAFKRTPETPSFTFANEEPEIFGRIQNWMYDKEFVFKEEKTQTGEFDITSTQNSQEDEDDVIEPEPLRVAGCLNERGERISKITHRKPFPGIFDLRDEPAASDDDEAAQAPENTQTQIEAPTPLDTLTLSKIYTFAEQLEMSKLCDEIIEVLGRRLGYDKVTPSDALLHAFQRSKTDSPLCKLLIDFTARTAPINDMLETADLDTDEDSLELLTTLVKKLGEVRGNICFTEDEWTEHFEGTVHEYLVKPRK